MNFSGISTKTLLGRIVRLPLRWIPPHTVLPILQGELRGKRWITGSSNHGCWLGSYEYGKQRLFRRYIVAGTVVFDIGAHVGFYTLLASKLVGDRGRVIAFEPNPENLTYLHRHIHLNNLKNVLIVPAAVSSDNGQTRFRQGPNSLMGSISSSGEMEVSTVSLDELIDNGLIPVPAVMKMDIEGAEFLALQGAKEMLRRYHPVIFLATHSLTLHRECCEFLEALGYMLKAVTGDSPENTDEIVAFDDRPQFGDE